jgi:hypothetical protein
MQDDVSFDQNPFYFGFFFIKNVGSILLNNNKLETQGAFHIIIIHVLLFLSWRVKRMWGLLASTVNTGKEVAFHVLLHIDQVFPRSWFFGLLWERK